MKDIGGGEWYQLYRYDVKTGDVTLLTDGKARNLPGPWSSSGDQIAYMSTRRTGKDTDLWVMNPADPKSDHMVAQLEGGGWEPQDWSADDKKILLIEGISINETYLWLVDTTTGEKTALTPRDAKEKVFYGSGGVQQGREGNLRHDRQGFGVSAVGVSRSGDEAAEISDDEDSVGRGKV